ncbi:hypothetical protein RJ640_028026 [Escallonia rubra]|uniref:GDSL esterase/lipase n=1 Tax=Escallonia rubra TaxID=112253 RepID=A0AA88QNN8_9ASTE|nr:hypothetical protein RJ640_028026 [Escallonia rubra]
MNVMNTSQPLLSSSIGRISQRTICNCPSGRPAIREDAAEVGSTLPPCDYPAIYNFGDSNSDTGGISAAFVPIPAPYGNNFFQKPAGRDSDGRLIIDFIAEHLGLPYLSAYLNSVGADFQHGANFATGGSTIRKPNETIFEYAKNPADKSKLPTPEDFSKALYTFDIGQNDLSVGFRKLSDVQLRAAIPDIVDQFAAAVQHLYQQGARTFWVHNTGPIGCLPVATLYIRNPVPGFLDQHGCNRGQNDMALEFNRQLKDRVVRLRAELPYAAVTYVDVHAAKYGLISSTSNQGFTDPLKICCGRHEDGFNVWCGTKGIVNGTEVFGASCADPSTYVSWDGVHYSQAASQWIANHILNGSLSDPAVPIDQACNKAGRLRVVEEQRQTLLALSALQAAAILIDNATCAWGGISKVRAVLRRILVSFVLRVRSAEVMALPVCAIPAIYNFGDSNSDTGGISAAFYPAGEPYGETFFRRPAGRASDGRLIIDFIAERLGLPYLSAYLDSIHTNFTHGANFATGGSTIRRQNESWFLHNVSPFSLDIQVKHFDQFKARTTYFYNQSNFHTHKKKKLSVSKGPSDRSNLPVPEEFSKALYTLDIGQNDLAAGFRQMSNEQIAASILDIVNQLAAAVQQLYQKGARAFWIHNTGPIGCLPVGVVNVRDPAPGYLDEHGCIKYQNELTIEFNKQLKDKVIQLRTELSQAALIYVDMYSAKYELISNAKNQGFEDPFKICCGHYGNGTRVGCGQRANINGTEVYAGSCEDPSTVISWDGVHYTEAANLWITNYVVNGSLSDPPIPISQACPR